MTYALFLVAIVLAVVVGWSLARLTLPDTDKISAQEVRDLVAGHNEITETARELIDDVFAAGERQLREVLVPRTEVEFLDGALPLAMAAQQAADSPHSRFPVFSGNHDEVIGFVHVRDLLNPAAMASQVPLADAVRPVLYLPAGRKVLPVLSEMRRDGQHLAIVIDEYGGTAGIITMEDLVEELIGDIRDEYDVDDSQATRLQGGVIEVDGLLNAPDFEGETGITLPEGPYETIGGFLMASLGHVPSKGDSAVYDDHLLTVSEMDGRRIARVRVAPVAGVAGPTDKSDRPNLGAGPGVVQDDEASGRIGT